MYSNPGSAASTEPPANRSLYDSPRHSTPATTAARLTVSPGPTRVLLIAPSMDILGGQAVQAAQLVRELSTEPGLVVDFQPIDARLPTMIRRIPYLRTLAGLVVYCCQLLWRIPRYDIVHTFSAGLSSFALWTVPALTVSRWFGKKFILNYHDGQAEQHLRTWRHARRHLLRATIVVSPSQYVVDVFRENGIPARRIPNFIDLDRFHYRQRRHLRPHFMTNRILEPLYNVGCVLRAFAIVQSRFPEATLVVAHDGVCRPELEALARDLGLRNTRFVGRVPHAQIPDLYDRADIYLTSSNFDCMPCSLHECFASGLPLISTRAGGIPWIVTHEQTGQLVDLDDHEGMARAAIRLLEDPDFVERSTRRAYQELEQYRWSAIRRQWLDTYQELAPAPALAPEM